MGLSISMSTEGGAAEAVPTRYSLSLSPSPITISLSPSPYPLRVGGFIDSTGSFSDGKYNINVQFKHG